MRARDWTGPIEQMQKDYNYLNREIKEQRQEMNRLYDRILSIWVALERSEQIASEYEELFRRLKNA